VFCLEPPPIEKSLKSSKLKRMKSSPFIKGSKKDKTETHTENKESPHSDHKLKTTKQQTITKTEEKPKELNESKKKKKNTLPRLKKGATLTKIRFQSLLNNIIQTIDLLFFQHKKG
jgi:hypothetical protein